MLFYFGLLNSGELGSHMLLLADEVAPRARMGGEAGYCAGGDGARGCRSAAPFLLPPYL